MSNADEPPMQLAFERWHGLEVGEDMDIQTEVAWANYRQAWEASASHARERLAKWMMSNGLAAGRGDAMVDLLDILSDEIQDMRDKLIIVANFPSHPGGLKADRSSESECPSEWRDGWSAAVDEIRERVFYKAR